LVGEKKNIIWKNLNWHLVIPLLLFGANSIVFGGAAFSIKFGDKFLSLE